MKYAGIILRNTKNSVDSVRYGCVADALLEGGISLDEISLLPYDEPTALSSGLLRFMDECEAVFVICDRVLLPGAREAVSLVAEKPFDGEFLLETEKCQFFVLPTGRRGEELVRTEAIPSVDRRRKNSYSRIVVCAISAPTEKLLAAVSEAQEEAKGRVSLHVQERYGCAKIQIIYDRNTPKMVTDSIVRILASRLEDYVYAIEDVDIAKRLFDALSLHRLTLSTAESFTGGGVGQAIVAIPGASNVFFEGLNVYDSRAKKDRLGVSEMTLLSKGPVSDETAFEMAAGLLKSGRCDIAVATTGAAGPEPVAGAPVGLCYIAVGTRERVKVFRFQIDGDRETITKKAINYALYLAYRAIK